jgi:hypothetical protein
MRGKADDGSLIYYEDRRAPPTPDMVGEIVIVELDTGEVLVKRLLRADRKGCYDLESVAGPTRKDARVKWAAHIPSTNVLMSGGPSRHGTIMQTARSGQKTEQSSA